MSDENVSVEVIIRHSITVEVQTVHRFRSTEDLNRLLREAERDLRMMKVEVTKGIASEPMPKIVKDMRHTLHLEAETA